MVGRLDGHVPATRNTHAVVVGPLHVAVDDSDCKDEMLAILVDRAADYYTKRNHIALLSVINHIFPRFKKTYTF